MKYYPLKNLLGINCHPWDMISHPQQAGKEKRTTDLQNAIISTGFTWLRVYSDADTNKDPLNRVFLFNPEGRGYETDTAIMALRKANPNLKVNFCYQNLPYNIKALWRETGKDNTQYRRPGTDPSKPESWAELAADMAVIAGRGGSNPNVPDYPLWQPPNWWEKKQEMLKGAKIYDQVEGGNEWDNMWSNDEFLSGATYAPAWKAVYDAVKKADPNMPVSTTGVMTEDEHILLDAIEWARLHNGGKIPFDVYQFHCYPWGWSKDIANALPPEYNMIPAAKKIVDIANKHGILVDIGEWGFDRHRNSDMGVREPVGYDPEQYRGYLIARSIMGFAATGVRATFYYRIYQDNGIIHDDDPTTFETSSLFIKDANDNITRRFSGDVFKQIGSIMGEFWFDSVLSETTTQTVYRFTNGTQFLHMGWTKEQVDLVTEANGEWSTNRVKLTERKANYQFPAGVKLEFQAGDVMKSEAFAGGTIELSSKPVFVLVGGTAPTKAIYKKGYWVTNGKRVYYVNYKDGTWKLTNSKYVPL